MIINLLYIFDISTFAATLYLFLLPLPKGEKREEKYARTDQVAT